MTTEIEVAICVGKACRKPKKRFQLLLQHLADRPIQRVKCQRICKGPVVGLKLGGTWEWFRRLDTAKALTALDLLLDGEMTPRMKGRRVKKRRGKLRTS